MCLYLSIQDDVIMYVQIVLDDAMLHIPAVGGQENHIDIQQNIKHFMFKTMFR